MQLTLIYPANVAVMSMTFAMVRFCSAQIVRDAMHAPSQATTSLNFFPLANDLGVLKPELGLKTVYPYAIRHFNH